ncbi:DUF5677 domain-containing protein [Pseudomonas gingeri]|uniref:DUF5677 domain-containing protein n=1 Tax=Pseudomonas gingeri TaxID=117681 RepID=UPI0015A30D54|nr:DUF5677 domain-containing protein [Pseudomonas gingeri]NWE48046.1 hypothetical protein [Pseudomonas gingeri]
MKNQRLFSLLKNIETLDTIPEKKFIEWFEKNYETIEDTWASYIFAELDKDKKSLLREIYESLDSFKARLFETWKEPLTRLDSLIYMSMEIVEEINTALRTPHRKNSTKLDTTTRLHARSVQVASEISHLLKGGFADGAMARWRTLHETTVILKFIAEGDEDLAERFSDYQKIQRLSSAHKYNANNILNFEEITEEDIDKFTSEQNEILEKYEPYFKNKFGWAIKALNKPAKSNTKADFIDIEKYTDLNFLRNHYSFANQYVHAGIDSIGYKLGTSMSRLDLLLTGPSNEGLFEPIQCTSLSLFHSASALIHAFPDDDRLLYIPVMWLWHEALKKEGVTASDALQKKGDEQRD